jgi:hypothetical protein
LHKLLILKLEIWLPEGHQVLQVAVAEANSRSSREVVSHVQTLLTFEHTLTFSQAASTSPATYDRSTPTETKLTIRTPKPPHLKKKKTTLRRSHQRRKTRTSQL